MYSSSMSDGLNKSSCSNKQFSASNTSLDRQPSGSNLDPSSHWSFTTSSNVRFTYWQRKFSKCGYNQISRGIYIINPYLFHQGWLYGNALFAKCVRYLFIVSTTSLNMMDIPFCAIYILTLICIHGLWNYILGILWWN